MITHETRLDALHSVSPTAEAVIYAFLRECGKPLGASQIAAALKMNLNTVRSRLTEGKGLFQVVAKRCKANGLDEAIWIIAPQPKPVHFDASGQGAFL